MALVEGGGTTTVGASGPSRPAPKRKPAPGTTRLQQYVAEPSDVPDAVPSPSTSAAITAESLAAAYGGNPYIAPNSQADALGQGYALMRGETPVTEEKPEAITTQEQEQEAKTYRARTAKAMSWDDYLGLSDRARAAVDFNTMLVQARQKDLRSDYEPTDAQRETYDNAVKRMFGAEGVSETFAPETVALLNDIHFEETEAKRFDDLDDFLGLSAALTAKDLDRIGKIKTPSPVIAAGTGAAMDPSLGGLAPVPTEAAATNREAATMLAAGTDRLQDALTRGNQVLENWKRVAMGVRNESVGFFGGTANKVASPDIRLGENDEYFQLAFDTLADAANGPEVLGLIQKDLGDKDFKRFLAFADTKSAYSKQLGLGLGGDPSVQYRSPDEFRQVLGLGGASKEGEGNGADRG